MDPRIEHVWEQMLRNSAAGGLLAAFFLLTVLLFRGRLGPVWGVAFALIVFVRLLIPASPQIGPSLFSSSPISSEELSVRSEFPQSTSDSTGKVRSLSSEELGWLSGIAISKAEFPSASPLRVVPPPSLLKEDSQLLSNLGSILPFLWLMGAIALALLVGVGHVKFALQVRRVAKPASASLQGLLQQCGNRLGLRVSVPLLEFPGLSSPALFGLISPRILIPEGLEQEFSEEEVRAIFLHELAHLKRRDLWWNWLGCAVILLHWFNPLVWVLVRRFRADREQLCDRLAVRNFAEPLLYSATLLKLLKHFSASARRDHSIRPGLASIYSQKSEIKHRIVMIHRKPNQSVLSPCVTLLALVAIGWLTFPSLAAEEEKRDAPQRAAREEAKERPHGREVPRDGDQGRPKAPATRGDQDRPGRDAPSPEARGDRDREHPERKAGQSDGEREVPESRRDQPKDPRAAAMAEQERALRMQLEKMQKGLADARRAGRHEEAEMIERRADEMREQIERQRDSRGRGNPHEEAEVRLHHLRVAAENLERAGLHNEAREYREQAEQIERKLEASRRGGGSANEHTERLQREVHELHEIVGQLRREIEELKRSRGRD